MYNTNTSGTVFHSKGTGNGYVLTLGGKRFYIAGDSHDTPEMRAMPNIDVAFLGMNQPYTMTITMATNAVRAFRPAIVYPYHFGNVSPVTDPYAFKQALGQDLGIEVRVRKWY
jgi:L-ascorbate metabolism protein UlaG (beta-lactamase superfamily)